ncbi:MAG: PHP domain-containing protein [Phormidesmis sp. RL_2_1]|nr:PHP domain-containing protein [Phormidesmis sp. RL_2_1]
MTHRTATQDSLLLREVLQSINAQSCPKTYNFHMHTLCSDGKLTPAELMTQAVEIGLHGMAITDHHSVSGYRQARQWMEDWRWHNPSSWGSKRKPGQKTLPKLWTGVEVTADLADTDVHILGYAFRLGDEGMAPYLQGGAPKGDERQASRVIQAIQAAGGIAVLAHPVRYRTDEITLIRAAARLGIDGVETYYAYDNPKTWRPSPGKTERVQAIAREHNLLSSCGTDTHGKVLTRRL